nr:hypothetical protein Iba_chr07aCG13310 [Ipomoea batatas]GMD19636.1 hypothetical protein Iba_chr07eCG10150 [Ipomoea batatas]
MSATERGKHSRNQAYSATPGFGEQSRFQGLNNALRSDAAPRPDPSINPITQHQNKFPTEPKANTISSRNTYTFRYKFMSS